MRGYSQQYMIMSCACNSEAQKIQRAPKSGQRAEASVLQLLNECMALLMPALSALALQAMLANVNSTAKLEPMHKEGPGSCAQCTDARRK